MFDSFIFQQVSAMLPVWPVRFYHMKLFVACPLMTCPLDTQYATAYLQTFSEITFSLGWINTSKG